MAAIITQDFKKQIIQSIYNDVVDSAQQYFIAIGRSEDWDSSDTVPTPLNSLRDIRNARLSLQSLKSAEDISFVVPRVNWSSGTIYKAWDDAQQGYPSTAYYVLTENNAVYICLQQGKDANGNAVASTIQPTGNATTAFITSDGYTWKFLYTITALNSTKFLTANYFPVRLVGTTDSSSPALDVEQKAVQNAAIAGQISSIALQSGGTGYTSAPTVTIVGDGTGASATATVSGGSVVKIEMDNESAGLGSGYTYADVVLSGGGFTSEASARAIFSVANGFGADPRDELKSSALMFNTKPSGDEGGDFIITNDFRQVVLIKNIKKSNDSDFTGSTSNLLNTLKFSSISTAFTPDRTIQGVVSGAKGYVDKYDTVNQTIYFHQTEDTGFLSFSEGETVNETNGSGSGVLDSAGVDANSLADSAAPVNKFSGTVLYIDNRAAISRSSEQTEDIKAIIRI